MRLRKLHKSIARFWEAYGDLISLFLIASLIIILPIIMFRFDPEGVSSSELLIKGVICALNGMTVGLLFAKYIYQKKIEKVEKAQVEREMEILLRFRETIAEITKNHRVTVSEIYANTDIGIKRPTNRRDKTPH
ncbi:hypothetical protein RBG11_004229 [Vibrio parahaemolyticus]|nr:hypothetical protein [Vibrio parahaemolyticus]